MTIKTIANHSEPLKLDLQFFASEEDDFILPDDTVETDIPESDDSFESEVENEETPLDTEEQIDPENPEQQQEQQQELPKFKVKYNKEEKELTYDEAVPLIQMGMNYDKLQERLQQYESDPRLQFLDELANQAGMTPDEYIEAVRQQREQQQLDELIQNNIPEDIAQEILESRKDRAERKRQQEEQAQRDKQSADFAEFYDYFSQANGRTFDPVKDRLPQEVIDANNAGVPLKYAYMEHLNNTLKSQVQVLKQNETNKQKAPIGSVTTHGGDEVASEDPFLVGFNSI
ncbi:hypothetical protein NST63_17965 [Heyndrickxia sp. FSL W8-0496]|uniref:hypothetical protein n=1 Tax=Heyndrickxia sp. FSL W8-0496 TaxID=2954702 RepID=UPI0030FD142D